MADKYERVDAILLSTVICGHRGWGRFENINVWHLEETINLLILDTRKDKTEKGLFYFLMGMNLFGGLTKEFLLFQQRLDSENGLSIYLGEFDIPLILSCHVEIVVSMTGKMVKINNRR